MPHPTDLASPHDTLIRAAGSPLFRSAVAKAIAAAQAKPHLVTFSVPIDAIDPLAALEILGRSDAFRYFWEHPEQEFAIAAGEAAVRIQTHQPDRFRWVSKRMETWQERTVSFSTLQHSLTGAHFLGGFSFNERPQTHHWRSFGNAGFVVPEWLLVRDGQLALLTLATVVTSADLEDDVVEGIGNRLARILDAIGTISGQSSIDVDGSAVDPADTAWNADRDQFLRNVARTTDLIREGVFRKLVLAREVRIALRRPVRITHMLNHLRSAYPTCYTFLYQPNRNAAFIGASPERLASFRSTTLLTEGLAGTKPRGKTATEDAQLERSLLHSGKDLQEHRYVVDAIEDRLSRYTSDIHYPSSPSIRKYRNVQHLYTPISALMSENTPALAVLDALHPTPAVGGHPMREALDHLQELEHIDRGWFAGPVGWYNAHGRGEFCVGIRSGLLEEGRARLFAGCGIVEASDPDDEWAETQLKLDPMRTALTHG